MSDPLDLSTLPWPGCTDGGCVFGHPGGMHTNGGCKCVPRGRDVHPDEARAMRDKVKALASARSALIAEVKRLRADRERAREALPGLLDDLESATAALAVHDAREAESQRFHANPCLEKDAAKARAAVLAALAEPPAGGGA